jgi:uncharacterized membrane protein
MGEHILGRNLNRDIWNSKLFVTALVLLPLIMAFLLIFFSGLKIPQIPAEKKATLFRITEIVLVALYSSMLIFLALSSYAIRLEEAYSLSEIQYSWKELIHLSSLDVHPPLYFLILKAASLVFGSSVAAMKMVSVFPTILMIIFVSHFLKKEFSDKAAIIFLLSCIVPQSIAHYSIEIRMYSFALFFITMMAVSAWYFINYDKIRWWIIMLFCTVGAAYTHNFAAAAASIGYLLIFFYVAKYKKNKIIAMLFLAIFAIALYSPWIPAAIEQFMGASNNFWIPPLTIRTVARYVSMVISTGNILVNLLFFLIFCFVFVHFLMRKNKTEKDFFIFGGLCCAILLVFSGILVSIIISPLFYSHYLIPVCGLVWLFFAVESGSINKKQVTAFLCTALFIFGIMSFSLSVYKEKEESRISSTFYEYVSERIQKDDAFIVISSEKFFSNHMIGIINIHLFPNHITAGKKIDTESFFYKIFGNSYTEYEPTLFDDRTVWTVEMEDANNTDMQTYDTLSGIKGELCGSFGWDVYQFKLYKWQMTSDVDVQQP